MTITINPRPDSSVTARQIEQLRRIPPATIGHMLDFGFMANDLRPIGVGRGFTLCGPAVTVRTSALDSGVVHHAVDIAEPGDVLVIDRNGDEKHACWGELTSLAAKIRGLAGTIVDGPATDIPEIWEMEYLTFCRGVAPITSRSTGASGEINTSIHCGGVPVSPGDIILADDNGILVIPADQVAEIIDHCGPRVEHEAMIRRRLLAGEKLGEITGASDRLKQHLGD
ncbi:MAG: RraA family protein [Thermomicrobiales bacterium]